jgi:hypothetical protein
MQSNALFTACMSYIYLCGYMEIHISYDCLLLQVMSLIGEPVAISVSNDPQADADVASGQSSPVKFDPSPQLKEAADKVHDALLWRDIYLQTLTAVYDLYHKCRLVHADLSEYNILLKEQRKVFVIDFGQAVDISHPEHLVFLRRDLETISTFFGKHMEQLLTVDVIMSTIVGDLSAKLPVRQKGKKGQHGHSNRTPNTPNSDDRNKTCEDEEQEENVGGKVVCVADGRVLFEQAMQTLPLL